MNEWFAADLEVTTAYRDALDVLQFNAIQAADIDQRRFSAAAQATQAKWLAPANRTELVLDDVLVEGVCDEPIGPGRNRESGWRHEPEQETFTAAVRAVALDDLLDFAIDRELDGTAMAATGLHAHSKGG